MANLVRFSLLLLLLSSLAAMGEGLTKKKPAWQWTTDERVQARLDPALRAERVRAAGRRGGQRAPADVIEGRIHPELFFSTQLFESLVYDAFVSLSNVYPRYVAHKSPDLFRDPEEWRRFQEITRDFAKLLAAERANLESHGSEKDLREIRRSKCAAKARALRTARETFGRERFDAFLYQVVAPPMNSTYVSAETIQESVEALRRNEANCQ